MKKHKNPMYACFAFFPNGEVKRWKYVTDLKSFGTFLNKSHSTWKYFNVYNKNTREYLKRFYPGTEIPKRLSVLAFILILTLTLKITFSKTVAPPPIKFTFSKTTFGKTTFTNGFNNSATIPTSLSRKEGVSC